MATNYGFAGPRIVSDGLVLYLDAGNPNSYNPSAPLTWRDISSNGNNGTLTNGTAVVSTTAGNVMSFDGADDSIVIFNFNSLANSLECTISAWTLILQSKGYLFFGQINSLFLVEIQSNQQYRFRMNLDGNYRTNFYTSFPLNVFHKIDITWDGDNVKMYINGEQTINSNVDSLYNRISNVLNTSLIIGRRDSLSSSNNIVSQISIYNRALSPAEITQNYNATKGRFGL